MSVSFPLCVLQTKLRLCRVRSTRWLSLLCELFFFSGTVELGKRKKVLSFRIQLPLRSWEESNSHLIILHQINQQHLDCGGLRSQSSLQPDQPALSQLRGHVSFPASLGSQPPNCGLGPDITVSRTCLYPISGLGQGSISTEIPTCALYHEENFPGSRGSSHHWGLSRLMLHKGAGSPWERTSTSSRSR